MPRRRLPALLIISINKNVCLLTAKAWSNAVGMVFPGNSTPRALTPATPALQPTRVSPPNKLPDILSISSSKVLSAQSVLLVVLLDLSTCCAPCPVPSPPRRQHHPALVNLRPGKVQHSIYLPRTVSNPLQQTTQEAYSRWFKPRKLKKSSSFMPLSILKKRAICKEQAVHAEVCHCSTLVEQLQTVLLSCAASRNEPSIPQAGGRQKRSSTSSEPRGGLE